MCLSIPAKIEKIEGDSAKCTVGSSNYMANLNLLEKGSYKVGDYVLIHTGIAIQVLNSDEAIATLNTFEEFKRLNNELDEEEEKENRRII